MTISVKPLQSPEEVGAMHLEEAPETTHRDANPEIASTDEHNKTFRKVDWRLMPMLMALYLISNLDRANLGNAKIEGLEADLKMTGNDYNTANMMFFVPYILCEVPANLILVKFSKPSTWIGLIVTAWGIVMTCSGLCQSFGGLVGCRILLGVFEAGFFPGSVYLLSQWYPPHMTQFRMSLLYCAAALSGAFSGLLAAGIAKMSGLGGYNGWRWIFLLEGILTVLLGLAAFFVLPDSPKQSARWLSEREIRYLDSTYRRYRGVHTQEETTTGDERKPRNAPRWKILAAVLTDWQLYLQGLVFMSSSVPTYALKFTLPQIMVNMGYGNTQAQLLSAPPYLAGAISAVIVSTFADKSSWRVPFILAPQLGLLTAYAILFSFSAEIAHNVALCYTFVHVATISVYPIVPGGNTWTLNNLAGSDKRAMGIAFMIAMGNCGGIIGSLIFVDSEKPRYQTGWGTSLGFIAAGIASALTLETVYKHINKNRERLSRQQVEETYSADQLVQMGDRSPMFRYSL